MGFGFWGPSKGPKRADSDLGNKLQDPCTPLGYQVRPVQAGKSDSGVRVPYSHELIPRADVERHLNNAPAPIPCPGPKAARQMLGLEPPSGPKDFSRPKEYKNHERSIPRTGHYTEYPTKDYPYDNQTAKGAAFATTIKPNGKKLVEKVKPGYVRTITDSNKHIQGVLYHPAELPVPPAGAPGSKVSNKPLKPAKAEKSGALYPSQEVFRSQTFGPRQTGGLPIWRD